MLAAVRRARLFPSPPVTASQVHSIPTHCFTTDISPAFSGKTVTLDGSDSLSQHSSLAVFGAPSSYNADVEYTVYCKARELRCEFNGGYHVLNLAIGINGHIILPPPPPPLPQPPTSPLSTLVQSKHCALRPLPAYMTASSPLSPQWAASRAVPEGRGIP